MCWLREGYLTLPRVLIGKGRKGLTFERFGLSGCQHCEGDGQDERWTLVACVHIPASKLYDLGNDCISLLPQFPHPCNRSGSPTHLQCRWVDLEPTVPGTQ